jgi:TPR repeat protein
MEAANSDEPEAQFVLGDFYLNGYTYLGRDLSLAFKWFKSAEKLDYAGGYEGLGDYQKNIENRDEQKANTYYNTAYERWRELYEGGNIYGGLGATRLILRDDTPNFQDEMFRKDFFKEAEELGYIKGIERIADYYKQNNPPKAYELYKYLAKSQISSYARDQLAYIYLDGNEAMDAPKNIAQVDFYLEKNIELNVPSSLGFYGSLFYQGVSRDTDLGKAAEFYRRAAEQGNANAQLRLGFCYLDGQGVDQDSDQAIEWYRKAAEQGNANAQYHLAACYGNGNGVDQDLGQSAGWYRKAAEQGNAYAQSCLGSCYYDGDGVDQDLGQAVGWYRKAAEQGDAFAQHDLGGCYRLGQGVDQDLGQAARWYRKAAEQGHAHAQNNLGDCYRLGQGVDQDLGLAAEWYRKAAEQGDAHAQYHLGECYDNGHGVDKDLGQAEGWYRKAAEQSYPIAWAKFN